MKKTFEEVCQKINLAIDLKSESRLRDAIDEAQQFEKRGILGKAIFRSKPRWATQLHGGATPLGRAIKNSWLAGVEMLAPLSSMKTYSWEALPAMQCAEMGWREGLAVVAKEGFLDMPGAHGKTAIMLAAAGKRHECVAELIAKGACVNQQRNSIANRWKSPLHAAAFGGCAKSAKLLIAAGASVWIKGGIAKGSVGVSALDLALLVDKPSWAVAHVLLSAESGPQPAPAVNALGQTPIMAIMSTPSLICEALDYDEDGARGEDLLWRMIANNGLSGHDQSGMGVVNYANRFDMSEQSMDFKRRVLEHAGLREPLELSDEEASSKAVKEFLEAGFDVKDLSNELFRRECLNHAMSSPKDILTLDLLQVAEKLTAKKKVADYAGELAESLSPGKSGLIKDPALLDSQEASVEKISNNPSEPRQDGVKGSASSSPKSRAEMDAAVAQCLEAMGSMASAMARLADCVNAREAEERPGESQEASVELRDVSLGIMSRAKVMRDQIQRLANKACAPRKTG